MSSPFYLVTKTKTIHKSFCYWRPSKHRLFLGFFSSPSEAVKAAIKRGYRNIEVCKFCCTGSQPK